MNDDAHASPSCQNKSSVCSEWLQAIYLLYKYSEQPSKPSSSSSHFSAGVSWSDSVDANKHAPDSTRNFTIVKLLQLAAQCNGVQPSESWAFTSHPNSTKNLLEATYDGDDRNNYYYVVVCWWSSAAEQTVITKGSTTIATYLTMSMCPAQMALCNAVIPSSFAALGFGTYFGVSRAGESKIDREQETEPKVSAI